MKHLQQDGREKLNVKISETDLLREAKKFFNWRKLTMNRIYALGSKDWNDFIAYLYPNYGYTNNVGTQRSPFGIGS